MENKCIISKINNISLHANKFVAFRIKEDNLPLLQNHIPLFYILPEDKTPLLFNEIAQTWDISKSSLSGIINRYESLGLINKCMCDQDKRSIYISMNDEAVAIKKQLLKIEAEFLDLLLEDFNKIDRISFEKSIDKAISNIKK